MIIDRMIYPITALGPGDRLAIWTQGCSKKCENCASRELWTVDKDKNISVEDMGKILSEYFADEKPDGITVTGGDPLEQPEELLKMLRLLSGYSEDILVYTGYEYDEIEKAVGKALFDEIKKYIAVLIDGRYIDRLNDGKSALIGSTNQNIIFLKGSLRAKYDLYCKKGRSVQNVFYGNTLMSVGIHNREDI